MRDIKFRGKILGEDRWVYGHLMERLSGWFISYKENDWWIQTRVSPNSIGEYTGLNDKEGNEIYEGDLISALVLQNTVADGIVIFEGGAFVIKHFETREGLTEYLDWHNKYIKVSGNIYDRI